MMLRETKLLRKKNSVISRNFQQKLKFKTKTIICLKSVGRDRHSVCSAKLILLVH